MGVRVLVTGGCGFLGCYILKDLVEHGYDVISYDIQSLRKEYEWLLGKTQQSIIFEKGSIEDLSEVLTVMKKHRIESVVHAATIVNPPLLLKHPILAYRVNIGGTINMLEATRILELPRFLYISSNGVFTSKQYEPIDEKHPVLLPNEGPGNGPYSVSKIACEAFGMSYGDTFGFSFISLRPSAVYGFGMQYPMFIKPMVENSVKGLATHFDSGRDMPRDYTYVRDVSFAVLQALEIPKEKIKDRIFLIATGEKLTTPGEISEIMKELIPEASIEVGAGLSEWNKNEIKYRGMIDITRAREQLGYHPKYDLRKGVKEYIEIYKKYFEKEGGKSENL
jgi:nucleoside-diphosphate-sugar epimerase